MTHLRVIMSCSSISEANLNHCITTIKKENDRGLTFVHLRYYLVGFLPRQTVR
jgi:hypothetical protein